MSNRLVFRVSGRPLQRLATRQRAADLEVIRHQIETHGHSLVVRYKESPMVQRLAEVPGAGEALPWYGTVGAAYLYTFRPHENGSKLKVEYRLGGFDLVYPGEFPPQELDIPEGVRIEPDTPEAPLYDPDWGWWFHPRGDFELDQIEFVIAGEMIEILVAWGWDGERTDAYEYRFIPMSVGCEIFVRDAITGEEEHLTKDVCW